MILWTQGVVSSLDLESDQLAYNASYGLQQTKTQLCLYLWRHKWKENLLVWVGRAQSWTGLPLYFHKIYEIYESVNQSGVDFKQSWNPSWKFGVWGPEGQNCFTIFLTFCMLYGCNAKINVVLSKNSECAFALLNKIS